MGVQTSFPVAMSGFRPAEAKAGGSAFDFMATNETLGHEMLKGIGRMFYLASPADTSFPDIASLPKKGMIQEAMPYFFLFIALEWLVLAWRGERARLSDGMMSVVHGLIMTLGEAVWGGLLFSSYIYVHKNYCLYQLPWDSTLTWVIAALAVDFCYYWVHRFAHEIHFLWAAHQVHHSSEEYNLSTALRQSAFQAVGSWPFYLPMAFFVPPSHAIIHKELNLLYQFWIHTELVTNLGPLELVLNTASHHRVHHGANRYALDKNYAGVLIIWDRMFGTFEAEKEEPKLVYGLVDVPQFWNPLKHQLYYYQKVWEKACSMPNWSTFFTSFFMGPGWFPGTPRLGDLSFVAEAPVREKYNPEHSPLLHLYTVFHFLLAFVEVDVFVRNSSSMSQLVCVLSILYILWTFTNIGLLYENTPRGWLIELIRCSLSLLMVKEMAVALPMSTFLLQGAFGGSTLVSFVLVCQGFLKAGDVKKD